ncbi:MAG: DUF2779 domain-containing protein [Chitinophagaceae bacterium]|nr:DUF2779 domain-containing protein [Chitinophagaceae bacterium]
MRVLTKSRFKLGLECPNKLLFTNNPIYANKKQEDSFLNALAEGGFQVEELARLHYPNGVFINAENYEYERAAELTREYLNLDNIIIYEAAFLFDGFFIRTDILVKKGNEIKLIEVKAKSFDSNNENTFLGKKGGIDGKMKPYLFDLAFQKKVAQTAFPEFQFTAFFMMADKSKTASIDGLNQLFRIPSNGNPRTDIIRRVNSLNEIGNSVLSEINVDVIINDILNDRHLYHNNLGFSESMELFKDSYINKTYLNWPTNFSTCKKCEFKTTVEDEINGLQSGFKHCFQRQFGWNNEQFDAPNAMEIWNYRGKNLMEEHRLLLQDVTEEDFNVVPVASKISSSERQWIQVEKSRSNDSSIYFEKEGLKDEMKKWKFPLHFIDFETSTVALPFTSGRSPYEQVAFQFSHHIYYEDGTVSHQTQFISNTPGEFPNFIFARNLYNALKNDKGTIFRFAAHENSILNAIIVQLSNSMEDDRFELVKFLKNITNSTSNSPEQWVGERTMIDLNKVIKDYYYNPYTKGSNSIKAVLPAILKSSIFLQTKYAQSLSEINLSSQNFNSNHIWLQIENNEVINPYKMLPPLFENWNDEELTENISELENIADGGAALIAYAKLQYQDMTEVERTEITAGLLKYCELDTLAMVMVFEHLKEICQNENIY